jgi:hypothetical protein
VPVAATAVSPCTLRSITLVDVFACRDIYICIAYAFGVSTAMEKTNVAAGIAQVFVMISEWRARQVCCALWGCVSLVGIAVLACTRYNCPAGAAGMPATPVS